MITILHFWIYHPALLYGISFLLGILSVLNHSLWIFIPLLALWLPIALGKNYISLTLSILIFSTGFFYAHSTHHLPQEKSVQGNAKIAIQSISLQHTFYGERWVYRCNIKQFVTFEGIHYSHIPCTVSIPVGKPRPVGNAAYWVEGRLIQKERGQHIFKVSGKAHWIPITSSWSLAEKRFEWKKMAKSWIESHFSQPLSGSFLAGLATGEFDDHWMRQQFARFGLQHLLAISGFHFAIVAGFLSIILRFIRSQKARVSLLLFFLAAYCFFLGPQPSILRAWMMCSLTLTAFLLHKQTTALNSLGIALLLILFFDPLLSLELGFQLSFGATAAILLFYQPAREWIKSILSIRALDQVKEMKGLHQHGYLLLSFLRESLALGLAVNVFAFPLTLFYFQQFPWMSLLYNLFFPFLASLSICLLILGLLMEWIPPLAAVIHGVNDYFTHFLLQLTAQIPTQLDAFLITGPFPVPLILSYLSLATLGGIFWNGKNREEPFAFI